MGFKLTAAFAILLVIGLPVGLVLLGVSLVFFFSIQDMPMEIIVQRVISGTQSFPLLAIPLFILAGELMNNSGIMKRVLNLAHSMTAHMTGGLAQVNVVLNTIIGGVGGSANGDAAMISRMLVPEMVKKGYPASFSAALTAAGSLMAPMIPPGIGLIIYGFVTNTSIDRLFIGGIVPGIMMGIGLMCTVYFISKKRGYGRETERRASFKTILTNLWYASPALVLPIVIIVGIRFGVFTPTESAAVAALVAIVISLLFYRELTWAGFVDSLRNTAITTSAIMLILAASSAFSWVFGYEGIPQMIAEWLISISDNKYIILLLIFVFLMVIGLFIEGTAAIILLGPIFLPIVTSVGIDPVHFGVCMVLTITIGGITPPVGTVMYTTCLATKVKVSAFTREVLPMLAALIIVNLLVIFLPITVTWQNILP